MSKSLGKQHETSPASTLSPSRREFVVAGTSLVGGLALGIVLANKAHAAAPQLLGQYWSGDSADPDEVTAWVEIAPDNSVTLRCPMAEMGQGTASGLPMLLAEELACNWGDVKVEFASVNRNIRERNVYHDMLTVGSRGIRSSWEYVQQAGASARERLIAAAAAKWNSPLGQCRAADGAVIHVPSGRRLEYGALAREAAKISLPAEPAIKPPSQYKLVGTRQPRLDSVIKTNGSAQFGIDTRRPGQLYASIISCPVFGGKLVSVDDTSIKTRRGIKHVVALSDAVAVIADNYWRANEALKLLKVVWDGGEASHTNSAHFRAEYLKSLDEPMLTARSDGDAKAALANAHRVVESIYQTPLLAHATMEPCNATVQLSSERLDVWMGSQSALANARMAAQIAELPPEQVYFHQTYLGGGFGRRSFGDELRQAVQIAKQTGITNPLQLLWSREQDMRADRYRPQSIARLKGALDADGRLIALHIETACASIQKSTGSMRGNSVDNSSVEGLGPSVPYNKVANWYTGLVNKNTHVPVGYWRSVGGSQNSFYLESFIDELAHAAGKDPLAFRLALTDRPDAHSVLNKLAELSDWGRKLPPGQGVGISLAENHGAIAGHVAEVRVDTEGRIRVEKVFAAIDAYHVVNPNLVEAQIEGGVIFGLAATLYGEILIENGAVIQDNFDNYRMVRLADAPQVEAQLALTGGEESGKPKWGGVGECSVAPIAAAVGNAIFAACGKRVRNLPLKNVKLTQLAARN